MIRERSVLANGWMSETRTFGPLAITRIEDAAGLGSTTRSLVVILPFTRRRASVQLQLVVFDRRYDEQPPS